MDDLLHRYDNLLAQGRAEMSRLRVGDRADCGYVVTPEVLEQGSAVRLYPPRECPACFADSK